MLEREDQYNKARARIFGNNSNADKGLDERMGSYEKAKERIFANSPRGIYKTYMHTHTLVSFCECNI